MGDSVAGDELVDWVISVASAVRVEIVFAEKVAVQHAAGQSTD